MSITFFGSTIIKVKKTPNNNPILGRNLGSTVLDASNISENVVTEAK